MPLESDRSFVIFHCGETLAALPLESVEKIAPMAQLAHPPGLPEPLEGILNLGGTAIPVLRLDHLLGLPQNPPRLYSMLLLAKPEPLPLAMLVDRVTEILHISSDQLLPVEKHDTFNACVQSVIHNGHQLIHVLSPAQILMKKEHEVLTSFIQHAQSRLANWEPANGEKAIQ